MPIRTTVHAGFGARNSEVTNGPTSASTDTIPAVSFAGRSCDRPATHGYRGLPFHARTGPTPEKICLCERIYCSLLHNAR